MKSSGIDSELPRVRVLRTRVSAGSFERTQRLVTDLVERTGPAYVSCANAYSLCLAVDDSEYGEILERATCVTADGMSVVWALRLLGHRCDRAHNDDLFLELCARHPTWRHFLVGGRDGQPQTVAATLARRIPGIRVVGTHATPRRPLPPEETQEILTEIRDARPDIVWVGMGTPAQDVWMSEAAPAAGLPMVGVGSAFDLLAGRTRPAPRWMKRSGLQWLFRLKQEPGRLSYRYVYYNSRFVAGFASQLVRSLGRAGR